MATCDDLRLGGTLSGTGITGGTTINNTLLGVEDWSGVLGHTGLGYLPVEVSGRPGGSLTGDGLAKARLLSLNMVITRNGALASGPLNLVANTDTFLTLLAKPAGNYLEVDMPDATKRFLHVTALDPASIGQVRTNRHISVPLYSSLPYWHLGGNQTSYTSGGTVTNAGPMTVYDAVIVFAGDGTFANTTAGWSLTITGSSGAVTVDLGARTVTQAGIPADQLLTRTDRDWGWFLAGANTVTGSATVTFRAQYN